MLDNACMKFRAQCYLKLKEAFDMFGIDYYPAQVSIRISLTGTSVAGKAGYKERNGVRRYYIDFNARAIERYPDELFDLTIPHEIAHIVCYMNPKLGKGHNYGWQWVCKSLGGDGKRHHTMDLSRR